ncbi:MAG: transposase [Saprospiraceae bacterium]|nr:transposase [Saprospiraceae bacterium]
MQNGYVERFNRTFREDILDAYLFSSLKQFNIISQKWRDDYNALHPHESLGNKSPYEFAIRSVEQQEQVDIVNDRVYHSSNIEKSSTDFSSLKCGKLL